jgi:integrase
MGEAVKSRFRLFQRQGGVFYWQDNETKQQGSLGTKDKRSALKLLHAKNESFEQPTLNLALAKAYASAHDPKMATRTWRDVMAEMTSHGKASTQERCGRAMSSKSLDFIRDKALIATTSEDLLCVMHTGRNSTNHYLRRLHNLAINLGWLAWPILAKQAWPKIRTARRRAVTQLEHERIISAERNVERRNFYEFLWETGCSQSDAAHLRAEDIDWNTRVLAYHRMKLGEGSVPAQLTIGNRLLEIIQRLPTSGLLFPTISKSSSNDRSAEFCRRCRLLSIEGVSLHSYRHAWAQRAKSVGYPERFAQAALGHASRAVHEAYARNAIVICPSLESYEDKAPQNLIAIPMIPGIAQQPGHAAA